MQPSGLGKTLLQSLLQPARRARLRSMANQPRELTEILYDMDCAERAVRHARLGLTPEDPLDAMKRLGELARKLAALGTLFSQRSALSQS